MKRLNRDTYPQLFLRETVSIVKLSVVVSHRPYYQFRGYALMKRQETVLLTVSSMAFFAAAVLPGCAPSEANSSGNSPQKATAVKTVSVIQQEVEQTSVQPATIHPYHQH